jgi:hypothetical protein
MAPPAGPERPRRDPGLLLDEDDDGVVAFAPSSGASAALNLVGAAVLRLCDGTRTVQEIAEVVVGVLPAERARVAGDVAALVARCAELGLLTMER